jgi:molecular chaperone IbpA
MMTNTLTLRALDIPSVHKFGIGFDTMFDELLKVTSQQTSYPPFNIIKKTDESFGIELAVAGFSEGEIKVELEHKILIITGSKFEDTKDKSAYEYIYRGIGSRSFERSFKLAEHIEVAGAGVKDGILTIDLVMIIPEEKKPKQIAITYNK